MLLFGLIYGHNPAMRVGLDATHPAAYFLGIVLALSAVAVLQAVVVFAVAWPLGALVVALSVFGYVGIGLFFAARFARCWPTRPAHEHAGP